MALEVGVPDIAEPLANFVVALCEADIGSSAFLMRRLVGLLRFLIHQKGTGEEIGEMGAVLCRHLAALLPERVVVCAVKGNDDKLLRLVGGAGDSRKK